MKTNNIGEDNSGYKNSGYKNSGDWNSGNGNSGDGNSGDGNSGYKNSGDWNSGNGNSGDGNSGMFNTDEPFMRAFNKETKIKMSDWVNSDDYIFFDIPLNEFIYSENMTDEEKESHPEYKTIRGYLKTIEYKEAWKAWWKENQDKKDKIKKLPNFDSKIFFEITGIDVKENSKKDELLQKAQELIDKANELKEKANNL